MIADVHEGGCLCGAVRYRVEGPLDRACHCHCESCRRAAGAASVTWLTVPVGRFGWQRGDPVEYRSSAAVRRTFCGACGTALTYAHDARPAEVDVTAATLDRPDAAMPDCHIWVADAIPWTGADDGLPRYPGWRSG